MLDESFRDVYTKFKLHFYQEVFSRFHMLFCDKMVNNTNCK